MSKKKKGAPSRGRGRPPRTVSVKIVRELDAVDIWLLRALPEAVMRNQGGRPVKLAHLVLAATRPAGMTLRTFVKQSFERQNGRAPTLDEIFTIERGIRRRGLI